MLPVVGPQSSVNERLVALEIVRQVLMLRFSLHVRGLVVKAINDTEVPIARLIRDALRTDAGFRDPAQVRQLDALIVQLNAMRGPAWQAGQAAAEEQLKQLEEVEPEEQRDMFGFLLPGVSLLLPSAVGLVAGAITTPFQGRLFRQWFADAQADDAKRIQQAIYAGAGAGDSPATIARAVVGTAGAMGRDGATQVSRNHIDTIIRSATIHFSAHARDQFYRANEAARYTALPPGTPRPPVPPIGGAQDPAWLEAAAQAARARAAAGLPPINATGVKLFALEQFVAVLDGRTTKLCRGLDGNRYKLGVGPIPPLHLNCRSLRILVLPESAGGPPYDPGKFGDWIRRQPADVKLMMLGSTKGNRMSDEDLAEAAFKDYGAKPMTLMEIRKEARRLMASY
jgi:hypothetical protein